MGEVKRYDMHCVGGGDMAEARAVESSDGDYFLHSDYARLERERDECRSAFERSDADVQALVRERDSFREWNGQLDRAVMKLTLERDDADAAASGLCGEVAELTMKLEKSQAELTRLRAVEKAAQEYKQSMVDAIEEDRPEWTRLRDIEVAARDMLAKLDSEGYSGPYMRALAEACGRKG